jgi:hypothetical protein
MASHVSIDMPQPITEPQPPTSSGIQPRGPIDPQAIPAIPLGVNPAQFPADSRDAEAQRGMLVYCFTGCNLIRVPGENYGDPSGRLWMMYLTEAEKEDKEITESWKGDAEGILVFVSARLFIFLTSSI